MAGRKETLKVWLISLIFKLTVSNMMLGGFIGYSGGSVILPWYTPPSKSESGGPRTVKCHSNKLSW